MNDIKLIFYREVSEFVVSEYDYEKRAVQFKLSIDMCDEVDLRDKRDCEVIFEEVYDNYQIAA
jgi:hypothetical protein